MRLVSTAARCVGVTTLLVLLAACGSSVADIDSRARPTTRAAAPQSGPFCAAVLANADAIRPLNGLRLGGAVPPEQLASTVDNVRRTGADLLNVAPDAIRADVARTVDSLNITINALVTAGGDATAAARDPAVTAQNRSPELAAAGQRVSEYINQNCGDG